MASLMRHHSSHESDAQLLRNDCQEIPVQESINDDHGATVSYSPPCRVSLQHISSALYRVQTNLRGVCDVLTHV